LGAQKTFPPRRIARSQAGFDAAPLDPPVLDSGRLSGPIFGFAGGDTSQWEPGNLYRNTTPIHPFVGHPG
jgi:hypothetical protein